MKEEFGRPHKPHSVVDLVLSFSLRVEDIEGFVRTANEKYLDAGFLSEQ